MEYLSIDFCEIMTDLTCLSLCFLTFVYLLVIKFRSKRNKTAHSNNKNPEILSDAFVFQLLKQQSARSFEAIIDSVNAERQVLEDLIEKPNTKKTSSSYAPKLKISTTKESSTRHHGQIVSLAEQGLNAGEISKKTKMPKGEIELIMKLKNIETNGEAPRDSFGMPRASSL